MGTKNNNDYPELDEFLKQSIEKAVDEIKGNQIEKADLIERASWHLLDYLEEEGETASFIGKAIDEMFYFHHVTIKELIQSKGKVYK